MSGCRMFSVKKPLFLMLIYKIQVIKVTVTKVTNSSFYTKLHSINNNIITNNVRKPLFLTLIYEIPVVKVTKMLFYCYQKFL